MSTPAAATRRLSAPASRGFVPRAMRSKAWFNLAYRNAKAAGLPVLQAIEAGFAASGGKRDRINTFKLSVECLIGRGAFGARKHFGDIARNLPLSVNPALCAISMMIESERRHIAALEGGGLHAITRDSYTQLNRLQEARLVLRLMRRYGDADRFHELRDDVATVDPLIAAFRDFHQIVRPERGLR